MRLSFLLGTLLCGLVVHAEQVFVDPHVVLQKDFQGWGTSLAWWADVVGGMDQKVFDHVIDELFSPSKLNLNIVRYAIGGTTPGQTKCPGGFRPGGVTESFLDGPRPATAYNWTRDARQRKTLSAAKAKGANVFEAFSMSPPQWLTKSGCSKGNPALDSIPQHNNFNSWEAPSFADYVTDVIEYFRKNLSITFTTYSPFHEPRGLGLGLIGGIGFWVGGPNSTQEGCNMDKPTMAAVVESMANVAAKKNMTYLKLAVSDEIQVNTQIGSYKYFVVDANLGNKISKVNVHGGWESALSSRKDLLSLRCSKQGHDLWMNKMSWPGTQDMTQGLKLAKRIVSDLNKMLPSAWVYWQAVDGVNGTGLLEVPLQKNATIEKIKVNSGYYALKHFSQHIKKGYQLISVSDVNSVAALSEKDKKLVIVSVNPTNGALTHTFDLRLFRTLGTPALFRTSAKEMYFSASAPSVSTTHQLQVPTRPQSITTVEFSGVELFKPAQMANLIKNGDFETTTGNGTVFTSWKVEGNDTKPIAVDAWRGNYSALIPLITKGGVKSIQQQVTLPKDPSSPCNLYLSARCFSNRLGTKLNVTINGKPGPVSKVPATGMFANCGLTFTANSSDIVLISYENRVRLFNGKAKIDNVVLHMICGLSAPGETDNNNNTSAAGVAGVTRWLSVVLLFLAAKQLRQ